MEIKKQKKRGAFTLVELLAATAIMIVLVVFVTGIAINMLRIYDKTTAALSTSSDAAMVLEPLQADFLSASMPDDGNFWFEVRYSGAVDNVESPLAPTIMLFARPQDRIRRKRSSSELLQGDLCTISYKLVHQSPFGSKYSTSSGNLVYGIYRAVLNAEDTLDTAVPYIIGRKGTNYSSKIPSKFWLGSDQITDPSDQKSYSISTWQTEVQNFLADGIVNLSLFFRYEDFSDGKQKLAVINNSNLVQWLRSAYPSTTITTFNKSIAASAGTIVFDDDSDNATSGKLLSVDVSLTVLTPEGRERLQSLQEQNNSGKIDETSYEDVLFEHGSTFTSSCALFGGKR